MSLLIPAIIALCTLPLVVALLRTGELFLLRARGGRLRLVRGRIPPALRDALGDVLARAGVESVDLRGVVEDGRAVLRPRGSELPGPVRQQLRNAISLWPVAKIRNAGRTRRG